MKSKTLAIWTAGALLTLAASAFAAATNEGQGQAVVTLMPKGNDAGINLQAQNLALKIDGKRMEGLTCFRQALERHV